MQLDADYLQRYIVIPTGQPLSDDLSGLRELEADFGAGVHVIWSDAGQSIVAFAFEPALFTKESARQWIDAAREAKRLDAIAADAQRAADPVVYVLASRLLPLDTQETPSGDDGLIWKEILRPGSWFKTDTGRRVDVTPDIILEAHRAYTEGMPQYISVPADHHHLDTGGVVPPESNRGFVAKLFLTPDYRWFAGFDIRDPETANGVRNGVIADCSVYLQPHVVHNVTGKKYPWALRHVLLTNNPLVNGLSGFGEKPLDAAGQDALIVEVYQPNPIRVIQAGGTPMPDQIQLTEQELAQFKAFKDLNLSADTIAAMQQRDQTVRQKARDLEIGAILNALQGKGQHAGVTQVEGYIHYPVVAVAVEKALKELPQSLALDADENGATGVDAVILSVVNAIPREGRVPLEQPKGRKDAPPVVAGDDGDDTAKKHAAETLDGLAKIL